MPLTGSDLIELVNSANTQQVKFASLLQISEYIKAMADVKLNINNIEEGQFTTGTTIDLQLEDSGGAPLTPDSVTVVGQLVTVVAPQDLTLLIPYATSDTSVSFTIVTDSDGTISSSDVTGLTSVVYKVNAGVVTLPFAVAVADVVSVDFDATLSDGVIQLIGTYA
tara:strand:- start:2598 stop:3095 length:498 start_codon:yes stop_codon:yes gene_type:complete